MTEKTQSAFAAAQKQAAVQWKANYLARANEQRFNAHEFVQDVMLFSDPLELPDEKLGQFIKLANATWLKSHGYSGPKSDNGQSLIPFYTAVLHRVKARFGDRAVFKQVDAAQSVIEANKNGANIDEKLEYGRAWFRGVRDETAIKDAFISEANTLYKLILSSL